MITPRYVLRENQQLKQVNSALMEQLEAVCEALGNVKHRDHNLYLESARNTGLNRKTIAKLLGK